MNLLKEHYESIIKYNGFCIFSKLSKQYENDKQKRCSICNGPKDSLIYQYSCSKISSINHAREKLEEIEKAELLAKNLK